MKFRIVTEADKQWTGICHQKHYQPYTNLPKIYSRPFTSFSKAYTRNRSLYQNLEKGDFSYIIDTVPYTKIAKINTVPGGTFPVPKLYTVPPGLFIKLPTLPYSL